jgi:hypothetical protein
MKSYVVSSNSSFLYQYITSLINSCSKRKFQIWYNKYNSYLKLRYFIFFTFAYKLDTFILLLKIHITSYHVINIDLLPQFSKTHIVKKCSNIHKPLLQVQIDFDQCHIALLIMICIQNGAHWTSGCPFEIILDVGFGRGGWKCVMISRDGALFDDWEPQG